MCFFIQERRKLNEGVSDVFGRVRKHFPRDSVWTCKRKLGRGGARVDITLRDALSKRII